MEEKKHTLSEVQLLSACLCMITWMYEYAAFESSSELKRIENQFKTKFIKTSAKALDKCIKEFYSMFTFEDGVMEYLAEYNSYIDDTLTPLINDFQKYVEDKCEGDCAHSVSILIVCDAIARYASSLTDIYIDIYKDKTSQIYSIKQIQYDKIGNIIDGALDYIAAAKKTTCGDIMNDDANALFNKIREYAADGSNFINAFEAAGISTQK